jgi:tetratricopeptide (TPR) repeat protein
LIIHRYRWVGGLGLLLAAQAPVTGVQAQYLLKNTLSFRQSGALQDTKEEGPSKEDSPDKTPSSDPYQDALKELAELAAFSPEVDHYAPAIQAILRHVCINDQTPTKSELKVARLFLPNASDPKHNDNGSNTNTHDTTDGHHTNGQNGHGVSDVGMRGGGAAKRKVALLENALKSMPGINPKPKFAVSLLASALGNTIGSVKMSVGSKEETLFDIPGGKKRKTIAQRCQTIKSRMDALRERDPLFWTHLSVGTANGETVIATSEAPNSYIITADQEFARTRGCTPTRLANILIGSIRNTFDPSRPAPIDVLVFRAGKSSDGLKDVAMRGGPLQETFTDADRQLQQAYHEWQRGNEAFSQHKFDAAEKRYMQATLLNPNYVLAFKSLANLYTLQKKTEDARNQYQKALNIPDLAAADKSEIQALLLKLK